MLIKLHSYVENPDYDEKNGLLLQNQLKEMACLVSVEDIMWVFPTLNTSQGATAIKFRNGQMLTLKESLEEIQELINTPKKK